MLKKLQKEIRSLQDLRKAKIYQRFFKTGKGEYGEGDVFLGLTVPQSRRIAAKFRDLALRDLPLLLKSRYHEERFVAVLILVEKFRKLDFRLRGNARERERIFRFYLQHTTQVNNWDLVDVSADKVVGEYLFSSSHNPSHRGRGVLERLARSQNVWERRIAIISTFYFIRQNKFDETLHISKLLLNDTHDLIHKAVGWMLREVGKRSLVTLENFLKKNCKKMPRTALRYAIERLPQRQRLAYLKGIV